jgi:hypothetical protein
VPVLDKAFFLGTDETVGAVSDIVGANLVSSQTLFSIPMSFDPGIEMVTLEDLQQALTFRLALERGKVNWSSWFRRVAR